MGLLCRNVGLTLTSPRCPMVTKVELTPELMRYLLERNDSMGFGAFGVDSDGDIFFEHAIVGSSCDGNELKASVLAVAMTADTLDAETVARWGGQRAVDRAGCELRPSLPEAQRRQALSRVHLPAMRRVPPAGSIPSSG